MEEVPKIVQERLRSAAKFDVHPDPNLLAGFAEKSLTAREQAQVLDHLATCADCREIVALAAPEVQEQVAVAAAVGAVSAPAPMHARLASPASSRWTGMRWLALAGCVVVVGAVGLSLRHKDQTARQGVGSVATAAKTEAVQKAPAQSETDLEAKLQPAAPPVISLDRQKSPAEKPARATTAGDEVRRYDMPLNGRSIVAFEKPAGPPPPPPSLPTAIAPGAVGGAAGELWKSDEAKNKKGDTLADKTAQANANVEASSGQKVEVSAEQSEVVAVEAAPVKSAPLAAGKDRAEQDLKRQASASAKALPSEPISGYTGSTRPIGSFAQLQIPPVRWTISPDGKLLRSLDQGKSWQTVPVATGTVLRALCANGPEVWVGGAGGALYHSSNAGESWKQVKLTAAGQVLTADITGIEFLDPKHGIVTTADKQTWMTGDGGENWQKK